MGGQITIIIAWELKKIYTGNDYTQMVEDFIENYNDVLDYPTIQDYISDFYENYDDIKNLSEMMEEIKEDYYDYVLNEIDLFIYFNEDLFEIKTIEY